MKITVKNLGPIKEANVDIGNFTIITGKNNTGKTYFTYALYGFLKTWSSNVKKSKKTETIIEELFKNGIVVIDLKIFEKEVINNFQIISQLYSKSIHSIFSANEEEFSNTTFSFEIPNKKINYNHKFDIQVKIKDKTILQAKKENNTSLTLTLNLSTKSEHPPKFVFLDIVNKIINQAILTDILPDPYVITSERTGINIFQKELDINKNVLFEKLIKSSKSNKFEFDPFDFLKDVFDRYSKPIQDSIERVRDKEFTIKNNSFLYKEHPDIIKEFIKSLSGVSFKINKDGNKKDYFITYKEGRKIKGLLPLYLSSSSTRSLLDFYIYLKHIASKNDILIIDEPELNLHPELQVKFVRILSSLVNLGIKVLITTHSDYIVKEINNLIMINNLKNKSEFIKKYKYGEYEYINPNKLRFYIAENNSFINIETDEFGLKRTNFDETIDSINNISEELFNKINEE